MVKRAKRFAAIAVLAIVATSLIAAVALWRDPFLLVRGEFARQRVAAGLSRASVDVAGHRWSYAYRDADAADAPTVVMLHGFTGSKENWYPLAAQLEGRYRLLIPDLPGWGESERKPGAVYGFTQQAANVVAFVRALSPGKPVVLLGHSMGGGIAALAAARYPQDIGKVGLLDAAGVRFKDNQFGLDVLAGRNPFAVEDDASLKRYIDIVFHDANAKPWLPWPASTAIIRKRRADAEFEQGVLTRIGRSEEMLLPGKEATNIRQPALLLWCRQDAVIDASALELYAQRIPQARKVLLDGCGHMSLMERPAEVADAVVALVDR
ncbi:lipase [Thermomonas carbonis]|uniref:Alpha/beta hydrolase n=1 Tax=Thermomonas carbonis TaxID=1463158 RepID=A0A7G9STQ4_9GAMM|nr:alpha/beta hydrolase [Thermomonas carbonis]GHC11055.1 lipase [Thermomonas carbonis]